MTRSIASARFSVPTWCRLLLLYIEPLFAINGAFLCLYDPSRYVGTMTRHTTTILDPSTFFLYTELAGSWLHFAFTEAVLLRLVDDVKVWRLACVGMLLSDIAYAHSCAQALGGWSLWIRLNHWTAEDWTVTLTTWPMLLARVVIALKIGWKETATQKA